MDEEVRWYTVRGDGSGYRELPAAPRWEGADVSPDGRRVAGSDRDGIWTARIDGSARRNIVRIQGASTVSWSPSGAQLAFVKDFQDQIWQWRGFIYIVRADGKGRRRVGVVDGYGPERVSWSSDGRRILFSSKSRYRDANATIYALDLATLNRTSLGQGNQASYSPDGKRIAFTVKKSFTTAIGRVGVANSTGRGRRLLNLSSSPPGPVWSPDSSELVGVDYAGGGLVVIRADGTKRHRVAPLSGAVEWLDWAR